MASKPRFTQALRALLLRVPIYLTLLFGGLSGALFVLQDRLLYFPVKTSLDDTLATARGLGLRLWPDAAGYRGLLAEPAAPLRGTLILLHGNAGLAGDRHAIAEEFTRLGLRVLLVEYPGYGPRAGQPRESVLVADALATLKEARARFGGPVLLAGESLGAGVAAAVCAQAPELADGLLLITPFDSLRNAARHNYPWVPVEWLLRDRYDSAAHLARCRRPVALLIAGQDRTLPPALGQALFAAAAPPKKLWHIAEAGHNDWMAHFDHDGWRAVTDFLLPEDATAVTAPPPGQIKPR